MRVKEWLYFLTDSIGNSYAISNSDVIAVPTPSPLNNTPDGWRDQMVNVKKSAVYYGTTREFSIPLRFVRVGAKILRNIVYAQGFEKDVYLVILKLEPTDQIHRTWYKGEIDFSQMSDERDFFDVTVAEGGLPKYLKANEEITYEIPLDEHSEVITFDGISLKQSTNSLILGWTGQSGLNIFGSHLPESNILGNEGDNIPTSVNATNYSDLHLSNDTDNDAIYNTHNPIFKATTNTSITFSANFRFKTAFYQTPTGGSQPNGLDPSTTIKVDLRIFNAGVLKQTINLHSSQDWGHYYNGSLIIRELAIHEVKGDFTFNIDINDEIFLYVYATPWRPGSGRVGGEYITFWYFDSEDPTFQPGTASIRFDFRFPETKCRALRADKLFEQLVSKLSEGQNTGTADFLKPTGIGTQGNPFRCILVTSGDGIRQLDGSVIKTSFKDFFRSLNVPKNIGVGYQGSKMVLDDKKTFFTGNIVYDLGPSQDRPKVTLAEDYVFSSMKIGYPENDYDDINGRNEFNNTFEWNFPIKRIVKELDLQSVYRADCYGIEYTRINLQGKNTTDNSSDNDVFMIDAAGVLDENGNIVWTPFRQIWYATSGLLSPETVFNVNISPKRCLGTHADFLKSFLYKLDDKNITYQTTSKNPNMSTTDILGRVTTEKADVPCNSLTGTYFQPFYLEFTTRVPMNLLQLVEMSRAGRFQFSWDGNTYRGILIDASIKPATMEQQTFKLLASIDCDLTKLAS